MTLTTLSLETSRKVYELLGEYETESFWVASYIDKNDFHLESISEYDIGIPSPNFAELVRLIPEIGGKKKWALGLTEQTTIRVSLAYMLAPTESSGMELVDAYLSQLLT